jgi:type II secretory pathway component HofQ
MDADYLKRKEESEFQARREERVKAAEDRTAKKRAKRQKKKQKRMEKRSKAHTPAQNEDGKAADVTVNGRSGDADVNGSDDSESEDEDQHDHMRQPRVC